MKQNNLMRTLMILALVVVAAGGAQALEADIEVLINGRHLGQAVLVDDVLFLPVDELESAIDPEGRSVTTLRVDGEKLYTTVDWFQRKGALTIQRSGLVSAHLIQVDGRSLVPLADLERALGGSLRTDEKACVFRLQAGDCSYCPLAPTHWYYTTAT
ncbi:MAG: hypothetical protein GY769_16830 [bacterium]|nr:hypothetical protein [bacterium]